MRLNKLIYWLSGHPAILVVSYTVTLLFMMLLIWCSLVALGYLMQAPKAIAKAAAAADPVLQQCRAKGGPEASYRLNKHGDPYCTDKRGKEIK